MTKYITDFIDKFENSLSDRVEKYNKNTIPIESIQNQSYEISEDDLPEAS